MAAGVPKAIALNSFGATTASKIPDRGPLGPRLAIWVLPRVRRIKTNGEINAPPCTWGARSGKGYGCANIVSAYTLDPIDGRVAPDATRQDDWNFSLQQNPIGAEVGYINVGK